MKKFIGRTLGTALSFSVFALGLWAVNNADQIVIVAFGYVTAIVGTGMIGAVSTQIGKDFDEWDRRQ